jgi:hypothetical protein
MKKFIVITAVIVAVIMIIRGSIVYESALRSLADIWNKAVGSLTRGE